MIGYADISPWVIEYCEADQEESSVHWFREVVKVTRVQGVRDLAPLSLLCVY